MKISVTVGQLCRKPGMSRQNYYKERRERRRREADRGLIEQLVRAERAVQPRLGGRKLFHILGPEPACAGVKIGRDRFFEVLREKSLLLDRLAGAPRTTNSRHSLPVFRNLVKEMELTAANQAWAGDITYIRSDEGFLYLSLLMDMWSRKIIGYYAGDTLEAEGAIRALEMALRELPEGAFPVHHSDRGCQYCSHRYVETLTSRGLGVSMTEEMHGYENARAERLNGILKQEYGPGSSFLRKKQALAAIDEAVFEGAIVNPLVHRVALAVAARPVPVGSAGIAAIDGPAAGLGEGPVADIHPAAVAAGITADDPTLHGKCRIGIADIYHGSVIAGFPLEGGAPQDKGLVRAHLNKGTVSAEGKGL